MSLSRGHKHELQPKVEINIIPLVDVVLVLLVIFMMTAAFVNSAGMSIKLPSSSATRAESDQPRDVVVGVDQRGAFYWGGKRVSDDAMNALLANERQQHGTAGRIIVQADARAMHGRVVAVMTLAQQAGFSKLVVATEQRSRRSADGP